MSLILHVFRNLIAKSLQASCVWWGLDSSDWRRQLACSPLRICFLNFKSHLTDLSTFAGLKQEGVDLNAPSAAETRVASGEPVGDPSGATPSLTPSNAQIAEARSLAGGKVRAFLQAEEGE